MAMTYDEQRIQNIKDNEALLLSLGLSTPCSAKVRATTPKAKKDHTPLRRALTVSQRKRPNVDLAFTPDANEEDDNGDEAPSRKSRRRSLGHDSASPARRSERNSGRRVVYSELAMEFVSRSNGSRTARQSTKEDEGAAESDETEGETVRLRNAQRLGTRTQDPKTFGNIPGVEVGKWWATRMNASTDAIHAPVVAGISGNAQDGAYSVALSGGYPDDVDLGIGFTYTGSGGRDLKGTKQNPKNLRTAPQTSDQSFDTAMNAALKRSAVTKRPVRVIRGFKLQSPYAPKEGYRYDGLYTVEKAWMAKGLTKGLLVCRYAFKRVKGQPPLAVRDLELEKREQREAREAAEAAQLKARQEKGKCKEGADWKDGLVVTADDGRIETGSVEQVREEEEEEGVEAEL